MGENPHPKPWNASCHVGKKQSFAKNPAVLKGPWTKVSPSFGSLFAPSAAQPDVVCYTGAAAALKVCTEAKTPSVTNSGHHWGAVAQTFHLCALTARLQQAAAKFLPAYTSLRLILLLGQGGGNAAFFGVESSCFACLFSEEIFLSAILSPIHPQH